MWFMYTYTFGAENASHGALKIKGQKKSLLDPDMK